MNFLINRKTYENKVTCAECEELIYDSLQASRSDLRFGETLCIKCYKSHMKLLKNRDSASLGTSA
jgi:formylmethanofuran dehydrogenase subunit E